MVRTSETLTSMRTVLLSRVWYTMSSPCAGTRELVGRSELYRVELAALLFGRSWSLSIRQLPLLHPPQLSISTLRLKLLSTWNAIPEQNSPHRPA